VFIPGRADGREDRGIVVIEVEPQIRNCALSVLCRRGKVGALTSGAQHGQAQDTIHRGEEILRPNDRLELSNKSPRAAFCYAADCWMDQGSKCRPLYPSPEPHADQEHQGVKSEALERAQPSSPSSARERTPRKLLRRQRERMWELKGQSVVPQLSQSLR